MSRVQEKLTYANVVATIALFGVVAGGGAYAAGKIGSHDIKANAIKSKHVANGRLKAVDFAKGQLPSGPQGEQGAQGTPGAPGSPAASMVVARINGIPSLTVPGTVTHAGSISGTSTAVLADTSNAIEGMTMVSPPVPVVARDLTVTLTAAAASATRTVTVRELATPYLSCTVSTGSSSCSNTTSSSTIPASTPLYIAVRTDAMSAATTSTDALVTWRATTP